MALNQIRSMPTWVIPSLILHPAPTAWQFAFHHSADSVGSNASACFSLELTYGKEQLKFYSEPIQLILTPDVAPLELQVIPSSWYCAFGKTVSFKLKASGGVPPYQFGAYASPRMGGDNFQIGAHVDRTGAETFSFTPPLDIDYDMSFDVYDKEGRYAGFYHILYMELESASSSLSGSIQLDRDQAVAGETITAAWTIAGGKAPYIVKSSVLYYSEYQPDIDWSYPNIMYVAAGENSASIELPENFESGELLLIVEDAEGQVLRLTSSIITPPYEASEYAFSNKIELSATQIEPGQSITGTCTPTLGSKIKPEVEYTYTWITQDAAGQRTEHPQEPAINKTTSVFSPPEGAIRGHVLVVARYMQIDGDEEDAPGLPSQSPVFWIGEHTVFKGDADGSREITPLDLIPIIQHLVSNAFLPFPENANADGLNGVDIQDILWIINQIVH